MGQEENTTNTDAARSVSELNRVTVVVPVYGHWPSLRDCVEALLLHAEPAHFDVLLVNDCGPEADEIEAGLRGMIYGHPHVRYERNDHNLGFVGTCNRAATELDATDNDILLLNSDATITPGALEELRQVLALSERHAMVSPRSSDATIATIPFFQRERFADRDAQRAHAVFEAVHDRLPRYYAAPVSPGFCLLVRRSIIRNHGLFDTIYGRGYNEENDLALRANRLGYSSLLANHAFVYHVGSTSFGSAQRAELEAANARVLLGRYPFYPDAVVHFIRNGYTAVDRFADLLVPRDGQRPKILLDLHHLSLTHDGSTRNALSFLAEVAARGDDLDVCIAAPHDVIDFFNLHRFGLRVLPYSELDEVFDLGVAVAPITALGQIVALNRFCLRWVACYLDIIALRSWELRIQVPSKLAVVRAGLAHADRVVAISAASLDDALLFFPELQASLPQRARVLHQGSGVDRRFERADLVTDGMDDETAGVVRRGGYALVMGGFFPHKQVDAALKSLRGCPVPIVAVGHPDLARDHEHIHVIPGGSLSDAAVATLYSQSAVVVFPSAYEGFGLPVVEAVDRGKLVLAFETDVVHEIRTGLGIADRVRVFSRFDRLPRLVEEAVRSPGSEKPDSGPVRTLSDFSRELWDEVRAVSHQDVDLAALARRDAAVGDIALIGESTMHDRGAAMRALAEIQSSRSFALSLCISRIASPVLRRIRRGGATPPRIEMRDLDRS